jgi:hypothetical protein
MRSHPTPESPPAPGQQLQAPGPYWRPRYPAFGTLNVSEGTTVIGTVRPTGAPPWHRSYPSGACDVPFMDRGHCSVLDEGQGTIFGGQTEPRAYLPYARPRAELNTILTHSPTGATVATKKSPGGQAVEPRMIQVGYNARVTATTPQLTNPHLLNPLRESVQVRKMYSAPSGPSTSTFHGAGASQAGSIPTTTLLMGSSPTSSKV